MFYLKLFLTVIFISFFVGCDSSDSNPAEIPKESPPVVSDLPNVGTYVLGYSQGIIAPNRIYSLVAFKPGEVEIQLDPGAVESGDIWGVYDSGGLAERLEALNNQEAEYLARMESFRDAEVSLELHKLNAALTKLEEALEVAQAFDGLPEDTLAYIEVEATTLQDEELLASEIQLTKARLQELEEHGRSREERARLSEFRINRDELESRIDGLKLKVPFSGTLEYNQPTRAGQEFFAGGSESLGTVVDYSSILVRVDLSGFIAPDLDLEDIELQIPSIPNAVLQFAKVQIEESNGSPVPIYYYELNGLENPKSLIGKPVRLSVGVTPEESVRVITKSDLLRYGVGESWPARLLSMYPDAKFFREGTYDISFVE